MPKRQRQTAGTNVPPRSMIFELFGLPRELGDEIYDRCHTAIFREHQHTCGLQGRCITADLRLVSRQFKAEYDDRCTGASGYLTVSASTLAEGGLRIPRKVASRFMRLRFKLRTTASEGVRQHRLWVSRCVRQFPRLRSIHFELHSNGPLVDRVQLANLEELTSIPKTSVVRNYRHGSSVSWYHREGFDRSWASLTREWSKRRGYKVFGRY